VRPTLPPIRENGAGSGPSGRCEGGGALRGVARVIAVMTGILWGTSHKIRIYRRGICNPYLETIAGMNTTDDCERWIVLAPTSDSRNPPTYRCRSARARSLDPHVLCNIDTRLVLIPSTFQRRPSNTAIEFFLRYSDAVERTARCTESW
jgi:hypothetical protein